MSQGLPFTLNVASTSSGRFLSKRTSSRGREPECGISFIPGFHIRAKLRPVMHARISNAPASITCSSNISAHAGSVLTSNAFSSSPPPVRFPILEAVARGSSGPGSPSTSAADGKTAEIPFMDSKRSKSPSLWPLNLQDADHSPGNVQVPKRSRRHANLRPYRTIQSWLPKEPYSPYGGRKCNGAGYGCNNRASIR